MSSTRCSAAGFCARPTMYASCRTRGSLPATVFSRATVIRCGSRRCLCAIERMRGGIVAEKSAVWRAAGRRLEDGLEVLGKAHVEHLVGLVEHQHAQAARGRASCGAGDRARALAWRRRCRRRARGRESASTWTRRRTRARRTARSSARTCGWPRPPASRARASARARGRACAAARDGGFSSRWCSIGNANAAVLPVPVAAWREHVAPGQQERNGLALHGRRLFVAERRHGAHEGAGEAECGKTALPKDCAVRSCVHSGVPRSDGRSAGAAGATSGRGPDAACRSKVA